MSRLYCDESGHTGPNPFDRKQPVFVLALVELDDHQERSLEPTIRRIREQTKFLSPTELKFSSLKGSPEGYRAIHEVGMALGEVGARAYFSVVEKLFLAPVLVVETFTDPSLNPAVPDASRDGGYRRWLANVIYEAVDGKLLEEFFYAAQNGDAVHVRAIGTRLISRLRLHPNDRVLAACDSLEAGLEQPWLFVQENKAPWFPNPVMYGFGNLLLAADKVLEGGNRRADIVADVDREFGPVLGRALEILRESSPFINGRSAYGMHGPIRNIERRIEVTSDESLGVQIADLMAGVIRWVAVATSANMGLPPDHASVWEPFKVLGTRGLCWWQASEAFLRRVHATFQGLLPSFDPI
jgi:hypothetical protein